MKYHIYGCSVRNGNSRAIAIADCKIITSDLIETRAKLKETIANKLGKDVKNLNIDLRFVSTSDDFDDKFNLSFINLMREKPKKPSIKVIEM